MMFKSSLFALCCLLIASVAIAQTEDGGHYQTTPGKMSTMELPNGNVLQQSSYIMMVSSSYDDSPMANFRHLCNGAMVADSEGKPVANNGSCVGMDAEGNTASMWWKMTEGGTEECPIYCGVWGFYNGTGKFASINGKGHWHMTAAFPDGALAGKWDVEYSME